MTAKLNIQDSDNIQIGSILCQRNVPQTLPVSKELKVDIHFLESQNQRLISDGFKCVMHKGSFTQEVVLAKIKKNSGHFVRVPTKTTCNIISE